MIKLRMRKEKEAPVTGRKQQKFGNLCVGGEGLVSSISSETDIGVAICGCSY